jgi:branched-chain amino acid transport system permease protein
MYFFQQFINGLCQGSIYALMAIGFTVVYGIVGLVTFTHGEVIMIGAFASFYCFSAFADNILLAIIAGFAASWIIGIFIFKVCYERFMDSPRHDIPLICTIGMSMLLKNLAQIIFGSATMGMPNAFENQFIAFGDIRISYLQLLIMGIVILLTIILSIFLNKIRAGMMLRAVSQDKKAASLVGINLNATTMIGNCIGCGLGGVAGVLLGLYYNSVVYTMGGTAGLKAFCAVVIGGLVSIPGVALGGLLLGICENIGIGLFSSGLRDVIAFVFLVIVLVIRPEGLFTKRKGQI